MNSKIFGDETVHPLIRVDMHCHSIFSDGTLTPEQIAIKLSDVGVKYASLTDHNTLAGLPSFHNALIQQDVAFIPGVEITTKHKSHIVHLLAYRLPTVIYSPFRHKLQTESCCEFRLSVWIPVAISELYSE